VVARRRGPPVRIRADAERTQALEEIALRSHLETGGAVRPHREVAFRRRLRIELPHRAGGRVARIREERLAALGALLVRRVERGGRQVHLAADVEASLQRLAERERYGAERAQVRGHVLAGEAVAPRRALHEPAVLVREVDREPVDLQLADVADLVAAERFADALVERARSEEHTSELQSRFD